MIKKIKNIFYLLRARQWYKNGLVFVGAFFSGKMFFTSLWLLLIAGFIILCCASSINYIINDLMDIEKDKSHPEKFEKRPLASGEISIFFAILILLGLTGIILFLIFTLIFLLFSLLTCWCLLVQNGKKW